MNFIKTYKRKGVISGGKPKIFKEKDQIKQEEIYEKYSSKIINQNCYKKG